MTNLFNKLVSNKPEHAHDWELISKTFAAPRRDVQGLPQISEALAQKIIFGVTTFLWECTECRQSKKEEMIGSDEDKLDSFMDAASELGPQLITRDGESYILSRYIPQPANPELLPVR